MPTDRRRFGSVLAVPFPPEVRAAMNGNSTPSAARSAVGAFGEADAGMVMASRLTDWLRNLLSISGPVGAVAEFRQVARGTGAIPWELDLDHEEARLLAPMVSAGPEAWVLARELREVIAVQHDRVLLRWMETGACPLDLHRRIPVPPGILRLGEVDPVAKHWLWAHWGTTETVPHVRLVEENADRRRRRSALVVIEFYSADWTPWRAIARRRRDWPKPIFSVRPSYDDA